MAGKNFLDQFSSNDKPDSFKEEVLVPSKTSNKPLNIKLIIIGSAVVVLVIFLSWFFFLRPTIKVPSFIGQEVSDVNSWLKQYSIQPSGIVFDEEYSEEYDSKLIIYQSIAEGKKVKKDAKINFTVSKGPDPTVEVPFPDIISMSLRDINNWISTNKLSGTKISYEFSDDDPLDSVISYEFGSNASETNFKRSSPLTIIVSKGKQSDQPISVPSFIGKNISEVTSWGSKNKIKIKQKEGYSSTVNRDMIISQSVNPGKKITSKETLTVTVSKGEPIYAPDFSSYSEANITAWGTKNNVNIEILRKYSANVAKDKVIEQSHKDKACNDGMTVTISLGNVNADSLVGSSLDAVYKWRDEVNALGANVSIEEKRINDDVAPAGNIISVSNVNVNSTVTVNISRGRNILLKDGTIFWSNLVGTTEAQVRELCTSSDNNGVTCKFYYVSGAPSVDDIGKVKEASRSDGVSLQSGQYISQDVNINIYIYEKN